MPAITTATANESASGTQAATTSGASGGEAVSKTDATTSSTAKGPSPSPAEIIDAWMGKAEPPEKEKKEVVTRRGGDAENEDEEDPDSEGEQEQEQEQEGPLDKLMAALLKEPENKDSAAYKRAVKLLGQPAELKRKLEEANARLADSEGPPVMVQKPTAADPLGNIVSTEKLQEALDHAEEMKSGADEWIEWCEDNKEGGTPEGGKAMDADGVKGVLNQARGQKKQAEAILKAAPVREKYLKEYGETRKALLKSNPELFKKGSPELAECVQLIQDGVISTARPGYMRDALDLIEGRKARAEREAGTVTVKLDTKKAKEKAGASTTTDGRPGPSGQSGGRTPGTRSANAGRDIESARQAASKGNVKALGQLIDAFADQN